MILAAPESIVDVSSPARGRGCLIQFKDKWLHVQVCSSHLYFIVTLVLCSTIAEPYTLHRVCYTLVLTMVSQAVESVKM